MKRKATAVLCALMMTACAAPTESMSSGSAPAPALTSAAPVTTSAAPPETATTPEDTTSAPAETSTAPAETAATPEDTTSAPAETSTSPEDTTSAPAETSAASTKNTASPAEITTAATTPAAAATAATSSTAATTTAATTAVTEQPEPQELPPQFREFTYDGYAKTRIEGYGIDTARREEKYAQYMRETKLPIIHVSTEDEQKILSREDYVNCLVDMFNCDEEYMLQGAEGGIRVRGNSTAYYGEESQVLNNQVPYRIKFTEKTAMLGLNGGAECKSWVLLKATWNVLPDYIAFQLADMLMKDKYYSSDCAFTYVYVNEKFMGLYLLCEQNQINEHRVDIPEVEKDYKGTDIGYFLELDNYAYENPYFFTIDYCGETLTDLEGTERALVPAEYTIKNDIYSQEQADFIARYLSDVYRLMIQAIKYDTYYAFDSEYKLIPAQDRFDSAYEAINAAVDLESVVNMYILYEITHDYDCGEGSFYMAVDFSGQSGFDRLTFTAPWDFNWAYGDSPIKKYYAGAFNSMDFVNLFGDRSNPWFILLMGTDWFRDMVKERWQELYSAGEITGVLDACSEHLYYYYDDFDIENLYYSGSAEELLKWVENRVKWLNMEWGG